MRDRKGGELMALTVKDILNLPSLEQFSLVAGKGGLDRDITTAGIADYEFAEGIDYDLSHAFERDSLVISSLLFAKDAPSLILPAIKRLNESGVSAFAYKEILFKTLPEEVISYADKNDFPIFSYQDGTWFENIIFDVMTAVERDDTRYLSEAHIEKMIKDAASPEEIERIRRGISLLLNKSISAAYLKTPQLDAVRVFRAYYMSKNLREKLLVSKYEDGIFILITTSKWNETSHRIILDEACQTLSLPVNAADITLSRLHPAPELHQAFREAYYAWAANLVSLRKASSYEALGVYAAILPLAGTPELRSYAQDYLDKLKDYKDTIKSYIHNGGDVVATSLDLHCHANTIRYRLNKMKTIADAPNETDHELFRDLSIAYIVMKTLENS